MKYIYARKTPTRNNLFYFVFILLLPHIYSTSKVSHVDEDFFKKSDTLPLSPSISKNLPRDASNDNFSSETETADTISSDTWKQQSRSVTKTDKSSSEGNALRHGTRYSWSKSIGYLFPLERQTDIGRKQGDLLTRLKRSAVPGDDEISDTNSYIPNNYGIQLTINEYEALPSEIQDSLIPHIGRAGRGLLAAARIGLSLTIIPGTIIYYEDTDPISLIANPAQLSANAGVEYVTILVLNVLDGANEVLSVSSFTLTHTTDVDGREITFEYEVTPTYTYQNSILNITGLANADEYEAAINTLKYQNTAEEPTANLRGVTITVHDSSSSTSANIFFRVLSVNDSPYFGSQPADLTITEGGTLYTTVSASSITLVGSTIHDSDFGSKLGIAVLGANNSHGSWVYGNSLGLPEYIRDGVRDADGNILRTTSLTQTCVVLKEQYIGFIPEENFFGATSITVVAWDQTGTTSSLSHGTFTNVTWTAQGDPFGSDMATVTVVVTPVNDAPHVTLTSSSSTLQLTSIDEDSDGESGVATSRLLEACDDVDIAYDNTILNIGVAITEVNNDNGTWQYTPDSGVTWSAITKPALLMGANGDINNEKIRFVPAAKFYGNVSIKYRCWDFTTGTTGDVGVNAAYTGTTGAYSQDEITGIITVIKINDRPYFVAGTTSLQLPVYTNAAQANELGTTITALISSTFRDADPTDLPGIAIVGLAESGGQFQYTCDIIDGVTITSSTANWYALVSANGPGYTPYLIPTTTRATVLSSTCSIRFIQDSSSSGSSYIDILAWDGSDGLNPGSYEVTVNSADNGAFGSDKITLWATFTQVSAGLVITGSQDILSFTEGSVNTVLFSDITITQTTTSQATSGKVTLTNPIDVGYEKLKIGSTFGYTSETELTSITGLAVTWDVSQTSVTFSGSASSEIYERAVRSVTFTHQSENPTASDLRRFDVEVSDSAGVTSQGFGRNLTLIAVNDEPSVSATANATSSWTIIEFRRGSVPIPVYGDAVTLTVSDPDQEAPSSITIAIDTAYDGSNEMLTISSTIQSQINVNNSYYYVKILQTLSSYDVTVNTLTFSLTGTAITSDDYTQALRYVMYSNAADPPDFHHRTARLHATDAYGANSASLNVTINLLEEDGSTVIDLPPSNLPGMPIISQIIASPLIDSQALQRSTTVFHTDAKFSSGDVIRVIFDRETNMPPFGYYDVTDPAASTGKVATKSQIDQLFDFDLPLQTASSVTNAYTGQWISSSTFEITVVGEGYPQPSVKVGSWKVTPKYRADCYSVPDSTALSQQYCIRDATSKSNVSITPSPPLDGNWGLNVPDLTDVVVHDDVKSLGQSYISDGTMNVVSIRPALSKNQLDSVCALGFESIFGSDLSSSFPGLSGTLSGCSNNYVSSWDAALDKTDRIPTVSSLTIRMQTTTPYLSNDVATKLVDNFNHSAIISVVAEDTGVDKTTLEMYVAARTQLNASILMEFEDGLTPTVASSSISRGSAADGDDVIRSGDIVTVTFDRVTNTPAVTSNADLEKIAAFNPSAVRGFGEWTNETTLTITLANINVTITSFTMTFKLNQFEDGNFVPDSFTDKPHCIGNAVCGVSDVSVGICDTTLTSCRAYGSLAFQHLSIVSIPSLTTVTSVGIDWWWLLLLGIALFICCALLVWLGRKVKQYRDEKIKTVKTEYDGYESLPPCTPASNGFVPMQSSSMLSSDVPVKSGIDSEVVISSVSRSRKPYNKSRSPTPLSSRSNRRITPEDGGVFTISENFYMAPNEYQRKVHFAASASGPTYQVEPSADLTTSDILAGNSFEEDTNMLQSVSEVSLRFTPRGDDESICEMSPDIQFRSDDCKVVNLRNRMIYDSGVASDATSLSFLDLQNNAEPSGSSIDLGHNSGLSLLQRSNSARVKWHKAVSLTSEPDLTNFLERRSSEQTNYPKRRRNPDALLSNSDTFRGDVEATNNNQTASRHLSSESGYVPSFCSGSNGSLRSINEQIPTVSATIDTPSERADVKPSRHQAAISGLPVSWYVNGPSQSSDHAYEVSMDNEIRFSSSASLHRSVSSGRRGLSVSEVL